VDTGTEFSNDPLTQDTTSLLDITTDGSTGDALLEDGRDLRGGYIDGSKDRLTGLGGSV
jgi:hypothetical protein